MKEFNRQNLKTLRTDIKSAIAKVAKRHNLAMNIGSISFSKDSFRTKLEAFVQVDGNSDMDISDLKELQDLKRNGFMFGLTEKHIGNKFISNGKTYEFTGISTSRRKYPISGTSVLTGESYKFTENVVKQITTK